MVKKLTIEKEAAACSSNPTKPASVKYFPEQIPSSSGDTTSSDTADSSSTLEEMFCGVRYILIYYNQKVMIDASLSVSQGAAGT